MDADDRLKLDYDQTAQLLRTLIDVRFKLLAFVPTVAGATVALFGKPRPAIELLAVGLLGLAATLGVFLYELRNSELYAAVVQRAEHLEQLLQLPSAYGSTGPGGLLSERPPRSSRIGGVLLVAHHRALGLVYGAALAGWAYVVAWGVLRAADAGNARTIGAAIGAGFGLLVLADVERIHRRADAGERAPDAPRAAAPGA